MQDKARMLQEAEAEKTRILEGAAAEKARMLQEAEAEKTRILGEAEAEKNRILCIMDDTKVSSRQLVSLVAAVTISVAHAAVWSA